MTDTITVTVRTAEPGWGSGLLRVCTRKGRISISCAHCGGRRGIQKPTCQHEDGITYWVDTWTNPRAVTGSDNGKMHQLGIGASTGDPVFRPACAARPTRGRGRGSSEPRHSPSPMTNSASWR